jgi:hypothetical protein
MYENGKIRPAETIPVIKKNDGGGEYIYDILQELL